MSIYDESTLGTSGNQIVFNDYTARTVYRMQARRVNSRQIRDLDIPVPFESGVSDWETLIGRSGYLLTGKMYPSGEADSSTGLAALRKVANLDFNQDDANTDFGYVPYIYSENGTLNRQIFLKPLYVDTPESTAQGLIQPFNIVCKIKDPIIYGYPAKSASTNGTDVTAGASSAIFPFTFPIVFGATTSSVTATATNNGTIPAYPASITVVGPVNSPRITNGATGEYIEITENLASSSNVLTITYDKDTLTVELDGNSVLSSVTSASTYFKLQPGANPITLSGSSMGSGAYVSVGYYDSYALS